MNKKLAAVALALLVVLSGCSATGKELVYQSDPAKVNENYVQESGYKYSGHESVEISRKINVMETSRTLTITNHVSTYQKSILGQPVARFIVFSTPNPSVAGTSVNPIASMSNKGLVEKLASRSGKISNIRETGTSEVVMFGKTTNLSRFKADAKISGTNVTIEAQVAKTTHRGDLVIAVGLYPAKVAHSERNPVRKMINNIVHPAEVKTQTESSENTTSNSSN